MRIKTLLCLAALAAGVATVSAQNVYSLNVVGYVKKSYPNGLSMIANPLSAATNTVGGIFGGAGGALPEGTQIYLWDGAKYAIGTRDDLGAAGWSPDGFETRAFAPGAGAFLKNNAAAAVEVVYVGEVLQGAASDMPVGTGYQMIGSKVPQAGQLTGTAAGQLNFPVVDGDQVYLWKGNKYAIYTADSLNEPAPWGPEVPTIDVAEGFFSRKAAPANWVRNFTVPQ